MKALSRARAVGGSLMVTIPREIVDEENFREGELLQVEVKKLKKTFFGIAKGIGSFTNEDEMKAYD